MCCIKFAVWNAYVLHVLMRINVKTKQYYQVQNGFKLLIRVGTTSQNRDRNENKSTPKHIQIFENVAGCKTNDS